MVTYNDKNTVLRLKYEGKIHGYYRKGRIPGCGDGYTPIGQPAGPLYEPEPGTLK